MGDEPKQNVLPYARQVKIHQVSQFPHTGWDWSDGTLWFVIVIVAVVFSLFMFLPLAYR